MMGLPSLHTLDQAQAVIVENPLSGHLFVFRSRRDDWSTKILPALRQIPLTTLVKECKGELSRRALNRVARATEQASSQESGTPDCHRQKIAEENARPRKE